jgi:signal peptidase I
MSIAQQPGASPPKRLRARGYLLEILETLVLTVLIFVGIQTFVAQPYEVEGGSMEQTVLDGEYVLIDKLTPLWSPYERGDIVVLHPPFDATRSGTPFIKRVIGIPGDLVRLEDGDVYLNGTRLDEPYVFTEDGVRQPTEPDGGGSEWVVPDGQLLVFGDHRRESADSRTFGPMPIANVLGRAWLRYWPLPAFGPID